MRIAAMTKTFTLLAGFLAAATPAGAAPDNTLGMAMMSISAYSSTVVQSTGVQSFSNDGAGRYTVVFDRNVANCVHVGGTTNAFRTADFGNGWFVKVRFLSSSPNELSVVTFEKDGSTLSTRPFSLIVFCPK